MKPNLFGVTLPQTSKSELLGKLSKISPGTKKSLFFLYSEFLLRANRNPWYKQTLNSGNFLAIDGKGLHWSMYRTMYPGIVPKIYGTILIHLPWLLRTPLFFILFVLEALVTIVSGAVILLSKFDLSALTKNELILGRDFVYDLLGLAEHKKWKTLIVGGNPTFNNKIKKALVKKYPKLTCEFWSRKSDSQLMRDEYQSPYTSTIDRLRIGIFIRSLIRSFIGQAPLPTTHENQITLDWNNLISVFPDLEDAKKTIRKEKPDLVLVCLGGASGKQELFIKHIQEDSKTPFTLAVGIGAALDHLGAGAQQTVAPQWMIASGLEWLHRFINQPYRRMRIFDSIFTLWWWTLVQEFMIFGKNRSTAVDIITTKKKEVLLLKRQHYLPGDVGWVFLQGGVNWREEVEWAGIREAKEEAGLVPADLELIDTVRVGEAEDLGVSFARFFLLGAKYARHQNTLVLLHYSGTKKPKLNWENQGYSWVKYPDVDKYLTVEKHGLWKTAKKYL